ncbi:MAG: glycosyltransferase family 2 protein [Salibacteraceae bacterium]
MSSTPASVAIITPAYNENTTLIRFLEQLENHLGGNDTHFHVVVVDDCSADNTLNLLLAFEFKARNLSKHPVTLRFNVGHQQAIYQGMLAAKTLPTDHFIIMDSDGEDNPKAILEMIQHSDAEIVHVKRGKRNESLSFRLFYRFYRILFRAITGKQMNFGNYCMIHRKVLENAVFSSYIHFPAFLSRQKASRMAVTWDRDPRLQGQSKMNLQGLLYHAFKSFVEYAEDLLFVFLKLFIAVFGLFILAMGNVLYQKFIAGTAITGWTSTIALGLLNLSMLCIGFFVLGVLLLNISNQRNQGMRDAIFNRPESVAKGE